jgi:hypothetical protein
MIRVHRHDRGPVFFGPAAGQPPGNRFDAPDGQYRTFYAAERIEGAFVETVLRRPAGRVLRREFVWERSFTSIEVQRQLTLAKIYDEGLQVHGIDAGAISVDRYDPSRLLALALYEEFPSVDGLAYRSRYNNGEICYALFDRVEAGVLSPSGTMSFERVPELVDRLMRLHGAVFDDSPPP